MSETVEEWCSNCEYEVELLREFKEQICPMCQCKILPCAQCELQDCPNCPL